MLGMMVGVVCLVTMGALRAADHADGEVDRAAHLARATVLAAVGLLTAWLSTLSGPFLQ